MVRTHWREGLTQVAAVGVQLAEHVDQMTPYAITVRELAAKLDAAELLLYSLEREVGFTFAGGELELKRRAFGR